MYPAMRDISLPALKCIRAMIALYVNYSPPAWGTPPCLIVEI